MLLENPSPPIAFYEEFPLFTDIDGILAHLVGCATVFLEELLIGLMAVLAEMTAPLALKVAGTVVNRDWVLFDTTFEIWAVFVFILEKV